MEILKKLIFLTVSETIFGFYNFYNRFSLLKTLKSFFDSLFVRLQAEESGQVLRGDGREPE